MPILAAEHGLLAAMWRWTADRLRNRPRLESWPVSLHLAHTKRVSVAALPGPCSGQAARAGTLARLVMNATAVSKSVQADHIIAYCAINLVQSGLHTLSLCFVQVQPCAVSGKPVDTPKRN